VENAPRRPGDPPVLIGTADRARSLLGWSPARSDLEHQISDAWSWIRKQNQLPGRSTSFTPQQQAEQVSR
jgi:UDP-glucose 4-epimerase